MARTRSPAYPGISLDKAIDRAEELWAKDRANEASSDNILKHWGYRSKSGAALVTLAALGHFGLLEYDGAKAERKGRLSDLAQRIILDKREGSAERAEAIREAALHPPVHREVWERYGRSGLPSDETLEWTLIREMGFTTTGAKEFIKQFHRTIAYAGLAESASVTGDEPEAIPESGDATVTPQTIRFNRASAPFDDPSRVIQIPAGPGTWVTLNAGFPLSPAAWDQMMRILEAMKPGLVSEEEEDQPYQDKLPE